MYLFVYSGDRAACSGWAEYTGYFGIVLSDNAKVLDTLSIEEQYEWGITECLYFTSSESFEFFCTEMEKEQMKCFSVEDLQHSMR